MMRCRMAWMQSGLGGRIAPDGIALAKEEHHAEKNTPHIVRVGYTDLWLCRSYACTIIYATEDNNGRKRRRNLF